ncbi:MAG: DUF5320 domain-containing protein [Fibrobacterota bacterium]
MPRGDGTGPIGAGPMTGRAAGYCAGYGMPGFINAAGGRGVGSFGRGGGGRGRGFGFRNMMSPGVHAGLARQGGYLQTFTGGASSREEEKRTLKEQAEFFKNSLESIDRRLGEIEDREKEN